MLKKSSGTVRLILLTIPSNLHLLFSYTTGFSRFRGQQEWLSAHFGKPVCRAFGSAEFRSRVARILGFDSASLHIPVHFRLPKSCSRCCVRMLFATRVCTPSPLAPNRAPAGCQSCRPWTASWGGGENSE